MKIKNISNNFVALHKIIAVEGSSTLRNVNLSPQEEILIYDEVAERSAVLKDLISRNILLKTGDAEPDAGVPNSIPNEINTLALTVEQNIEDIENLQLGKAEVKPLVVTADATNPTEVMALVNELKAKINSMNTII